MQQLPAVCCVVVQHTEVTQPGTSLDSGCWTAPVAGAFPPQASKGCDTLPLCHALYLKADPRMLVAEKV